MRRIEAIRKILSDGKSLLLIYLALAILMIGSALVELNQSKRELLQLMDKQSHALLETLIISSENILRSNADLTGSINDRLLEYARWISIQLDRGKLDRSDLTELARNSNIIRLSVIGPDGEILLSNDSESISPALLTRIRPMLENRIDTLLTGRVPLHQGNKQAFGIILKHGSGNSIMVLMDAEKLTASGRSSGFGVLLRNIVTQNAAIVYAALQDTNAILAASGNVTQLEDIYQSDFLRRSYQDSLYLSRTTTFDTIQILEAVHPFSYRGRKIGLFRLGLSQQPLQEINARIYRRLLLITFILMIIGSLIFTFLFVRQRYKTLQKEYTVVETYSGRILENVSDAIIVLNAEQKVQTLNRSAQELFNFTQGTTTGKFLSELFDAELSEKILSGDTTLQPLRCQIGDQQKYVLVSRSHFTDSEGLTNTILVIRDISTQKILEEQMERRERLSAMGELAAGVAHEIRNPLNTIATIVQQLNKDFTPKNDEQEYHSLAGLVSTEVNRINQTVQEFLQFSRPRPLEPDVFKVSDLIEQLLVEYRSLASAKSLTLKYESSCPDVVRLDRHQIKQALANLLKNAIEASDKPGEITINCSASGDELIFHIMDNGPGIPEALQSRIFNLYFTTKKSGTGIGLSLVQRIIYEHGGSIEVESPPGRGALFILRLPKEVYV